MFTAPLMTALGTSAAALGAGAAATEGSGLAGALGAGGALTGGLSGLANTIYGFTQMGREIPPGPAWKEFQRVKEPVGTFFQQQYWNPAYTGLFSPGLVGESSILSQLSPGQTLQQKYGYQFSPSQSTANIYRSFLEREYGLPETIARSMTSQAMSPLKAPALPQQAISAGALRNLYQTDASQLANVGIARQTPEILRNMDYLQGTGQLAAYNLWRTQMAPQLIG